MLGNYHFLSYINPFSEIDGNMRPYKKPSPTSDFQQMTVVVFLGDWICCDIKLALNCIDSWQG